LALTDRSDEVVHTRRKAKQTDPLTAKQLIRVYPRWNRQLSGNITIAAWKPAAIAAFYAAASEGRAVPGQIRRPVRRGASGLGHKINPPECLNCELHCPRLERRTCCCTKISVR
jgi:hypothetical protein